MAAISRQAATWADLVARPHVDRLEILGGQIVEKAAPSPDHASTEFKLAELIELDVNELFGDSDDG